METEAETGTGGFDQWQGCQIGSDSPPNLPTLAAARCRQGWQIARSHKLFSGLPERSRCRFPHQLHWERKCLPVNDPGSYRLK